MIAERSITDEAKEVHFRVILDSQANRKPVLVIMRKSYVGAYCHVFVPVCHSFDLSKTDDSL